MPQDHTITFGSGEQCPLKMGGQEAHLMQKASRQGTGQPGADGEEDGAVGTLCSSTFCPK